MNAVLKVETPKEAAARLAAGAMRDGYKPEALHVYADASGQPVYWRIRCKHPDTGDKWMRPMRWNGSAFVIGEPPAPAEGKPLYRLPELLAADPAVLVLIAEGEGKADALGKLGMVATTSGACTSASGADWAPLRGHHCLLWPDNDAPGSKYADDVAAILRALDCTVEIVDVGPLSLPDKGDAVDWLALHPDATAADVLALPRLAERDSSVSFVSTPNGRSENIAPPEPLPPPLPSVPAFDTALLPEAVRGWCEDAAEGLQVPPEFTGVPAMVALAGAIGRVIGVQMKRRGHWVERPIIWGCVIGRPSTTKSPALAPSRRMLDRLAGDERAAFEVAQRDFEARAMIANVGRSNAKDEVRKALKAGNKEKAQAAAAAASFVDEAPTEPRIVINDGTIEKIGELLNANPRGLVQFRDELAGWLSSLDREGHEGDRAFWLECWNGTGAFTTDRIGRGTIRIEACAVSILGGMQPGKLEEYVRGAVRGGFADDGLIQRLQLAVYPDVPETWRYSDRAPDMAAEAAAWATFKRLRTLDPGAVGAEHADWCDVPFLRFDDEAQELFIEWITAHMTRLRAGAEPAWMESHLAKYPGLVGRLALTLHLSDGHNGPIRADTLAKALNWTEYLTGHARRIYAPATDSGLSGAHLILKRRSDIGDTFTARDIYRRGWSGLADVDVVETALDVLVEYRHLHAVRDDVGAVGGRPSVVYTWRAA